MAQDGGFSHPWVWNGAGPSVDTTTWQPNLALFFQDLVSYGMAASLTLSLDPVNAYLTSPETDCPGTDHLKFYPWMPYGYVQSTNSVDCQNIYDGYKSWANANPYFWGWGPFQSFVTSVVQTAANTHLQMREFELLQEQNLISFTAEARLIYDNKHNLSGSAGVNDVLGSVRSTLQSYGYSPYLATLSTFPQFPDADTGLNNANNVDCGSVWGDSAMLLETSALMGMFAGPYGDFGWPNGYSSQYLLACGGNTGGMEQLPQNYSQPSVLDIHAYPCINVVGYYTNCNTSANATNTAETFYSDVWALISYRGITGATAMFGESSIIDYSCPTNGGPPSDTGAQWAVNGYLASSLRSNHASGTVFQPFNNIRDSCYTNPINITGSAYNPNN